MAGPLEKVKLATDKDGRSKRFAFVTFKHECSVPYTIELMNGLALFGTNLRLQTRTGSSNSATYDGGSSGNTAQVSPYNSPVQQVGSNHPSPHSLQRSQTWHGNSQAGPVARSPDINFRNLPNMQPRSGLIAAVSFQQQRERVLQQQSVQVQIHRQQVIQRLAHPQLPAANPYGRSSRPWQQAPYRRY